MWLLTTVSQSAWLVFSPEPGAPPVIRFRQPYGSWACGSQHPPPSSNLNSVNSSPHHIIDQSATLFFFVLYWILLPTGTALGLRSLKGRDNLQLSPQQASPALHIQHSHHVAKPLQFALPHLQSGFLVPFLSCPNPPKIVSCFYPALCSSNAYGGF